MLVKTLKSTIGIRHIEVLCSIGVAESERQLPQKLIISLEVDVDFSRCAHSDSLEDTIDYTLLARCCQEVAREASFSLLETFALRLADALEAQFPIAAVRLSVEKPSTSAYVKVER